MAELKDLAEFYTRAAAMKDPVIKKRGKTSIYGPGLSGYMTEWTAEERQPDFQCLIDSGIDCEFSDCGQDWRIGKLKKINGSSFVNQRNAHWKYCRPRLNHVHAWIATEDSKCPVPDGYFVKANYSNEQKVILCEPKKSCWSYDGMKMIIAFEVLPKAEENK